MIHIAFLLPYKDLAATVESVFRQHPRRDEISYSLLPARMGQTWARSDFANADVVIARGYAARRLRQTLPLLTIELQITGYDMLAATTECIDSFAARTIGIAGTFSMVYGADAITKVFPRVRIVSRTVDEESQLEEALGSLRDEGCEAVVGGRNVAKLAPRLGLHHVMLQSGEESVGSAVGEAIRAVEVHRAETRRSNSIAAIMNYTMEGIIAIDADGRVTMINQFAKNLCRDGGDSPVGRSIFKLLPGLPKAEVLGAGTPLLGEVFSHGETMLVANVVPLTENGSEAGHVLTFQEGPQIQELEDKLRKKLNPKGFAARYRFSDILGKSQAITAAKNLAAQFAKSDAGILIVGETGSGKEFFAQSIHNAGARSAGPFVAVNCAALPEQLLESELFGYVEGAFTGAARGGKAGLFELAHNGTIFLDEIGDIAPPLQARLLRVIQEREIIRLGHDRITPINVRVVAATNKDLYREVAEGKFRADLLYRLEVLKLPLPPLRERVDDIPILAESFFQDMRRSQRTRLLMLDNAALAVLKKLPWPGNVRELRNFCERLAVLTNQQIAGEPDVLQAIGGREFPTVAEVVPESGKGRRERDRILELLSLHGGSRKMVAAALEIDTSTLWRKMKRHGIG